MENGLVGTDVNPIAAHLTASSLAAIGDGERYGDTRVGWLDVGGAEGRTGSLEYFGRAEARDLFTTYGGRATGNVSAGETTVQVQDRTLRWILMNPPYSRTRGGQSAFDIAGLSDRERTRCQKKWRTLVTGEPVNNQAGMAASFLALAARKIVPGGRIGFVLPLTAAFADSWAPTRQMIEREFRNIVAVAVAAGQALGREALSADTGMEEMLLVATKRRETVVRPYSKAAPAEPIRCVTLRQPLSRLGEAGEIGRAITETIDRVGDVGSWQPIRAGDDELGSALVFDAGAEGGPWGPLGVTHADLALAADALTKGRIDYLCDEPLALPVPMSTIGEMFKVGPTHHLIGHMSGKTPIGAFEFHPTVHRQPEGDARQWDAENLDHILGPASDPAPGGPHPQGRVPGRRRFTGDTEGDARAEKRPPLRPCHALDVASAAGGDHGRSADGRPSMDNAHSSRPAGSARDCALGQLDPRHGCALDAGTTDTRGSFDDPGRSHQADPDPPARPSGRLGPRPRSGVLRGNPNGPTGARLPDALRPGAGIHRRGCRGLVRPASRGHRVRRPAAPPVVRGAIRPWLEPAGCCPPRTSWRS